MRLLVVLALLALAGCSDDERRWLQEGTAASGARGMPGSPVYTRPQVW